MPYLIFLAIVVGFVWFAIEVIGAWVLFALLFFIVGIIYFFAQVISYNNQLEVYQKWMDKYNDVEIVGKIIAHMYWQGQTPWQLRDSLGDPKDIRTEVSRDKKREIWKYRQIGINQYALHITLEDGRVAGWKD